MKKKLLLFTFLLLNLNLFAQTAPVVGTKWTYIQSSGFGENGNFYKLQVTLDTTIDGKLCKKMIGGYNCASIPNDSEFVHYEGKKVYRYDFRTRKFWLLYDWSAKVGDIVTVFVPTTQTVDSFKIRIDSLTTWTPNGESLRVYKFKPIGVSKWLFASQQIIEKMGANAFFFPQATSCTPIQFGAMRCFEEPMQTPIKFVTYTCDTVIIRVRTSDIFRTRKIDLSPNPSVSDVFLTLDAPIEGGFSAEVTNIVGQTIWRSPNKIVGNHLKIETNYWQSGFYLLTLTDAAGGKWSRQFVK
ncbi:MAG: T9SS type A sorting domain-containing protein [Saprospiraceae bacterium]|nr:T9SS type A sorting domain-containing protein [Saprospiraceae bacterium]